MACAETDGEDDGQYHSPYMQTTTTSLRDFSAVDIVVLTGTSWLDPGVLALSILQGMCSMSVTAAGCDMPHKLCCLQV